METRSGSQLWFENELTKAINGSTAIGLLTIASNDEAQADPVPHTVLGFPDFRAIAPGENDNIDVCANCWALTIKGIRRHNPGLDLDDDAEHPDYDDAGYRCKHCKRNLSEARDGNAEDLR